MSDTNKLGAAKELARASGNNFHSKVVQFLRGKEWLVLVSPYYVDPSTDKAREIDLIAEKLFVSMDRIGRENGYIRMRLHVECKYINQMTVFWFDNQDDRETRRSIESKTLFKRNNTFINQHHYLQHNQRVAKLFTTEKSKDTESEPMFRAINQTLNGLVNSDQAHLRTVDHLTCHKTIEYPVIVCSSFDSFFRKDLGSEDDEVSQIRGNFLMEVNYAYTMKHTDRTFSDYFLIDVVEFNQLNRFLEALQLEFEAMHHMI